MAKNLFEQFLDFASSKLAGPIAHENIYREESTELSGVAKYIAKQEMAAKAKEAAAVAATATSVEKYLARQAALAAGGAQAAAVSETMQEPLTGVAKYLAGQYKAAKPAAATPVPAPEPTTSVGRYLAGQSRVSSNIFEAAPAPAPEPTTSVGRYLAGQSRTGSNKFDAVNVTAFAPKQSEIPSVKAAIKEKTVPQKTVESAVSARSQTSQPHAVETPKPASSVIHLNDDKQCQASTTKGTQCKHTAHLGHIQRTINKQKYMFSVCNQHHNDTFKPYSALLEKITTV